MYSLSSLVGKSSKKSNHTTDGNHIYSSRWYPCKSRGDIQQPRQWSYRKWFFRCSRWALQNSRRYPSIIFLVLIRNCIFFFIWMNAGVFLTLLVRSMQRVKKLDKFETMIWYIYPMYRFTFIAPFIKRMRKQIA